MTKSKDDVVRSLPRASNDPSEIKPLRHYLDPSSDFETYRVPDNVLQKWGRLFDIVKASACGSCCFTRGYTKMVERSGSILQEAEDLDVGLDLLLGAF